MTKRVKVKFEHRRKKFYERFLSVWREQTEDKNQKYVIYKGMHNLKQFPLEVNGIGALRQIRGIGETLAVRCDNAWKEACARRNVRDLTLKDVKELNDSDYVDLINLTKSGHGKTMGNRPKENSVGYDEVAASIPTEQIEFPSHSKQTKPADMGLNGTDVNPPLSNSISNPEIRYALCVPTDKAEVILIADNREQSGHSKKKTAVEYLYEGNQRVELRPLSIGDYLWIARKIDGTEVVMDWVVERKTWKDLQQSIRKGRYEEQKQRLRRATMHNRVYLVEGTGTIDLACEQALATTLVQDNFLIQRCENAKETARFLLTLTERLKLRASTQEISGIIFEDLQELAKKSRPETVKQTWTRQLMVCPGMSATRAQLVANLFPSLPSLRDFYSNYSGDKKSALHQSIPLINPALSAQISRFFSDL